MNYNVYELSKFGDERGFLIPIEQGNNINFDIKRIFYIYNTSSNALRGAHANKFSEFLIIAVSGSCKVLVDDGIKKEVINLDKPNMALYLNKMVWKEMYDFSNDAVLLVISNKKYNKDEYIRDYNSFKKIINKELTL
jgi:dTDP-4-dehydrorhamnose 3,5-epimerase-like enzyme